MTRVVHFEILADEPGSYYGSYFRNADLWEWTA